MIGKNLEQAESLQYLMIWSGSWTKEKSREFIKAVKVPREMSKIFVLNGVWS